MGNCGYQQNRLSQNTWKRSPPVNISQGMPPHYLGDPSHLLPKAGAQGQNSPSLKELAFSTGQAA